MKSNHIDKGIEKPHVFREKDFVSYFNSLIQDHKFEPALSYLLESLPELAKRRINRKEKINHLLFMSRLIQHGSKTKHGYEKLLNKANTINKRVENFETSPSGTFVDFGCGAHDPIGLASYYYLNGFKKAVAIDLLEPRNEVYSGLSMYDILANMTMFPQKYLRHGASLDIFESRLKDFDAEKFAAGDFYGGFESLKDKLNYRVCDIVDVGLKNGEVSLLASFAVFEHVMELEQVCQYLYDIMMPGGIAFHFIDLADHRSYNPKGEFNAFSFLTEEQAPSNMNRARKSELINAFQTAGFEILTQEGVKETMPEDTRKKLLPKWADMNEEDKLTTKLYLVMRKPI